jgi:hypothetical protein
MIFTNSKFFYELKCFLRIKIFYARDSSRQFFKFTSAKREAIFILNQKLFRPKQISGRKRREGLMTGRYGKRVADAIPLFSFFFSLRSYKPGARTKVGLIEVGQIK